MDRARLAASFALLAITSASCIGSGAGAAPQPMLPAMRVLDGEGVLFVASGDETRPRLRYLDGQVSQNETCAIRIGSKLNPKIPPVYINGEPIGFC
jgi:hypothetical protein